LFSHDSHLALGQVGVTGKGRDFPAFEDLLTQAENHRLIAGKLLLGDALHTQKATCKLILKHEADYLFVVKGNQRKLRAEIYAEVEAAAFHGGTKLEQFAYNETSRGRTVMTTVTVLRAGDSASQPLLASLKRSDQWDGVQTIGVLHRTGSRVGKDGTSHVVDETIGVLSSRRLSAEEVATYLRKHWCIENNLHWVKDAVLLEDKHTLRQGNAPQVMSWLRSMCINLCNALKLRSISDTIHNLEKSPELLRQFLVMAGVV
jgi:predicted transposase YbfD/YdcC